MVAPNSSAARVPVVFSPEESGFGNQGPRITFESFCAAHSKSHDARVKSSESSSPRQSSVSVPVPKGLPLCFIDEQELRQPSNTQLRRIIRSHARRDTDLKRKQLNAALKSTLETPRTILGKAKLSLSPNAEQLERPVSQLRIYEPETGIISSGATSQAVSISAILTAQIGNVSNDSAVNKQYYHINDKILSDSAIDWQCQPLLGFHPTREWDVSTIDQPSNAGNKQAFIEHNLSFYFPACPICREVALPNQIYQGRVGQLLRRTASDPEVLSISNTLLGSSWRQDPFDIHSILHNPRVSLLLSYYNEVVNTVWVCSKSLWSFQTSTPALLHATMLYISSHLRLLSGNKEFDKDILHHKGETMRIINTSLDDPVERTRDQIIGALSSLILFEETFGSNQVAAVHRRGLKQLLQLRYTNSRVEIHRLVQHLLVHPQVDPDEPEVSVDSTAETNHAGRLTDLSRSLAKNRAQGTLLGHAVASVYVWLTTTAQRAGNPLQDQEEYPTLRNNIEVYLASFPSQEFPASSSGDRAWLIASMIYLHTIIVTPAEASPLPTSEEELVMQLKRAMEKLLSNPNGFAYPCSMRLWVMMMGGLYARCDDESWFEEMEGRKLCEGGEWDDAKVLLRDVRWVEKGAEEKLRGMPVSKEDRMAWMHLQGIYGDEVHGWKV